MKFHSIDREAVVLETSGGVMRVPRATVDCGMVAMACDQILGEEFAVIPREQYDTLRAIAQSVGCVSDDDVQKLGWNRLVKSISESLQDD